MSFTAFSSSRNAFPLTIEHLHGSYEAENQSTADDDFEAILGQYISFQDDQDSTVEAERIADIDLGQQTVRNQPSTNGAVLNDRLVCKSAVPHHVMPKQHCQHQKLAMMNSRQSAPPQTMSTLDSAFFTPTTNATVFSDTNNTPTLTQNLSYGHDTSMQSMDLTPATNTFSPVTAPMPAIEDFIWNDFDFYFKDNFCDTAACVPAQPVMVTQETDEIDEIMCSNCGVTKTPLWRRCEQNNVLCNACGLYLKSHGRPRPFRTPSRSATSARKQQEDVSQAQIECKNCATTVTPLWRRNNEGQPLCNACGLYLKLHGKERPITMRSGVIRKRNRLGPLMCHKLNMRRLQSTTPQDV